MEVNADFPPKLQGLFSPHRYKILFGGRGGAKSWSIARALLIQGLSKPLRILCVREMQNSMKDSVHKLLSDQIENLGLSAFYTIQRDTIIGANGTTFSFEGIKHNVQKIKSYEGIDICWVEEAVNVTQASWDILIPTIRKDGSEIWLSFNPELETDETYKRFVLHTPNGAFIQNISWRDNPWFTTAMQYEMDDLKSRDYDAYLHVWEGHCKQVLDGAVYAAELRAALEEKRILRVPYDHTKPVDTFWDLGRRDMTSIWFAQRVGFEWHLIRYYENRMKDLPHYLTKLQEFGYVYGTDFLPHDAKQQRLGMRLSIEAQMRAKGRTVRVLSNGKIAAGINMAREVFPTCYFDEEHCSDGLNALRHYCWDIDPDTKQFSKEPLHDEYSHGADAFRYFAQGTSLPRKDSKVRKGAAERIKRFFDQESVRSEDSWMQ